MNIRFTAGAMVILALVACASNPQKQQPVATLEHDEAMAEAPAVVGNSTARPRCKRVKPIGSHRSKLICQTAAQAAAETRANQDELHRSRATTSRVTVSPGG